MAVYLSSIRADSFLAASKEKDAPSPAIQDVRGFLEVERREVMTTTLPPTPPMNGEGSGNPSSAVSPATTRPSAADPSVHVLTHHEEAGVHKTLNARHLQMIALGSAIGTGLLLGSGSRLQQAGPSLAILYLVCGFFGYIILRNLGELVAYRPSSGSFVS